MLKTRTPRLGLESLEDRCLLAAANTWSLPALDNPVNLGAYVEEAPRIDGPEPTFIQIELPDADYQGFTTRIVSPASPFSTITSVADDTLTVDFALSTSVRQAPGGGWASWSSPPEAEEVPVRVYFVNSQYQLLIFSQPLSVFGVEMEPNVFQQFIMGSIYLDADFNVVGEVYREAHGSSGARLFAGYSTLPFTYVLLFTEAGAQGFAYGQVRYTLAEAPPAGMGGTIEAPIDNLGALEAPVLVVNPFAPVTTSPQEVTSVELFLPEVGAEPIADTIASTATPADDVTAAAFELVLSDLAV